MAQLGGYDPVGFGKVMQSVENLSEQLDRLGDELEKIENRIEEMEKRFSTGRAWLLGLMFGLGCVVYGAKDFVLKLFAGGASH